MWSMKIVKLICDDLLVNGEQKNFMNLIRLKIKVRLTPQHKLLSVWTGLTREKLFPASCQLEWAVPQTSVIHINYHVAERLQKHHILPKTSSLMSIRKLDFLVFSRDCSLLWWGSEGKTKSFLPELSYVAPFLWLIKTRQEVMSTNTVEMKLK